MLAKRIRNRAREHGLAEETSNSSAKNSVRKNGIGAVKEGRTSGEPRIGVRGVHAVQALDVSWLRNSFQL